MKQILSHLLPASLAPGTASSSISLFSFHHCCSHLPSMAFGCVSRRDLCFTFTMLPKWGVDTDEEKVRVSMCSVASWSEIKRPSLIKLGRTMAHSVGDSGRASCPPPVHKIPSASCGHGVEVFWGAGLWEGKIDSLTSAKVLHNHFAWAPQKSCI